MLPIGIGQKWEKVKWVLMTPLLGFKNQPMIYIEIMANNFLLHS